MAEHLSRRGFIGSMAAGYGIAGMAARARAAARDPNSQVVVGVMGLSRGLQLARQFARQAGVEVRYVCDVDSTRAGSAAAVLEREQGISALPIGDFHRILDDPGVDALVCAAPNHWHAPATILACAAGKHVYVEKPCSHNPQEGEWMVQAARKHQRVVQLGTQRRSGPGTIDAMRQLREGVIGRVYLSRSWYSNSRPTLGQGMLADVPKDLDYELWQGPAPRKPYVDNRIHYNWHWFWHWGNGELGNNGVHTLDLCRWGLGVDYPVRVSSSGGRYRYHDDQETPDTHTVSFEFEGDRAITWQGLSCNPHSSGFVAFYGENGTLELDSNGTYRIFDAEDKLVSEQRSPSLGDREHIANFLTAVRESNMELLNAPIAEGHKSTLLCHLGNIAHRTGRTLDCGPHGRIVHDADAMAFWRRDYAAGWEPVV